MTLDSHQLSQQFNKVLITGSSTGIGLELTRRLASEGYLVYATARNPEKAEELQKLAKQFPNNIIIEQLDVADSDKNIRKIIQRIGKVDILINNAGSGLLGSAYATTDAQRRRIFDVNYFGAINVTNAVIDEMIKSGKPTGKILFISSIVGPLVDLKQTMYSGTKAALEHYAADLNYHLKRAGFPIEVAGIHPGPVLTQFPASAIKGNRFNADENPMTHTEADCDEWREMMAKNGQPISQTVETILKVINSNNPDFWNPTHPDVYDSFNATYRDPTGNKFAAGPGLKPPDTNYRAKL